MRKWVILAVGCLFIGASNIHAQTQPAAVWELGVEDYYFVYKEPGVMREKGSFSSLAGSYTYRDNIMLKAETRISVGKVDYKNSGTMDSIFDFSLETRGLAGFSVVLSDIYTLTPYSGVGYRYLNDDSSGKITSTNAAGYERESNYFYSPLGLENTFLLNDGWSLGLITEYDHLWRGKQISHLSDANLGYEDVTNTQKKGYGLRGSVKVRKEGEQFNLIIEPFARYWKIAKSNDSDVIRSGVIWGYGYEPKNNTTELGVKVALEF